jgi:hypothetical protein
MNYYDNAKIYTLKLQSTGQIFWIGATCNDLQDELRKQWSYRNKEDTNLHKFIGEVKNMTDIEIQLHEKYPCNSRAELNKRQSEIIRQFKAMGLKILNIKYDRNSKHTCKKPLVPVKMPPKLEAVEDRN